MSKTYGDLPGVQLRTDQELTVILTKKGAEKRCLFPPGFSLLSLFLTGS